MYVYPADSQVTYETDGTPVYDRAVSSIPLRALYKKLLTNGILLSPSNNLQVLANTGMTVTIKAGMCVIEGALKLQETDITKTLSVGGANNRIDTIVARLNNSTDVRDIVFDVLEGTEATTPTAPTLTRTTAIYELALAEIYIAGNSTAISQSNITDTRLNTSKCGSISSITEFDTETLYNQIKDDLDTFKIDTEGDFNSWFLNIQTTLSGDTAGNLLNSINENSDSIAIINNYIETNMEVEKIEGDISASLGAGAFISTNTFLVHVPFSTKKISTDITMIASGTFVIRGKDTYTVNNIELNKVSLNGATLICTINEVADDGYAGVLRCASNGSYLQFSAPNIDGGLASTEYGDINNIDGGGA